MAYGGSRDCLVEHALYQVVGALPPELQKKRRRHHQQFRPCTFRSGRVRLVFVFLGATELGLYSEDTCTTLWFYGYGYDYGHGQRLRSWVTVIVMG